MHKTETEPVKLMNYHDLSQYLAVSESYLRRLVMEQSIPFIKFGRAVRFDRKIIDKWISQRLVS